MSEQKNPDIRVLIVNCWPSQRVTGKRFELNLTREMVLGLLRQHGHEVSDKANVEQRIGNAVHSRFPLEIEVLDIPEGYQEAGHW